LQAGFRETGVSGALVGENYRGVTAMPILMANLSFAANVPRLYAKLLTPWLRFGLAERWTSAIPPRPGVRRDT
jgi:hypothetical protein